MFESFSISFYNLCSLLFYFSKNGTTLVIFTAVQSRKVTVKGEPKKIRKRLLKVYKESLPSLAKVYNNGLLSLSP